MMGTCLFVSSNTLDNNSYTIIIVKKLVIMKAIMKEDNYIIR